MENGYVRECERNRKKFEMKEFPLNVIVEVGNHCNLNCTTCINDKLTRKKGFMDIFLYMQITMCIAEYGLTFTVNRFSLSTNSII